MHRTGRIRLSRVRTELESLGKSPALIEHILAKEERYAESRDQLSEARSAILTFVPESRLENNSMLKLIGNYVIEVARWSFSDHTPSRNES